MRFLIASAFALTGSFADAQDRSLIGASTTAEAAAVILDAEDNRSNMIKTAIGLGVADPVELVFLLISPETLPAAFSDTTMALTIAAPLAADEIAAATALSANITEDRPRLISLVAALMAGLSQSALTPAQQDAEAKEVLAALLAVANPDFAIALADAIAGDVGKGAALLAALGEGPETAAILQRRSFGQGVDAGGATPFLLTVTPAPAPQNAPSAN